MMKANAIWAAGVLLMAAMGVKAQEVELPGRPAAATSRWDRENSPQPASISLATAIPSTAPADDEAVPALAVPKETVDSTPAPTQVMPLPADAPVPSAGAACGVPQAPSSHCRHFWEWLTYQPLQRVGCCGDCHHCCGCCNPPLYTYFLCDGTGCGCGGAASYVPADQPGGCCHGGHVISGLHNLVHGGGSETPRP